MKSTIKDVIEVWFHLKVLKKQTTLKAQNYLIGRSLIGMTGRVTMKMKIKIPFDIDPDKEIPIEVTEEI